MRNGLPVTDIANNEFSSYDRYMINGYRYAQNLNVSGWNLTQAYNNFNPQTNGWGRYYDEYAKL